MFFKSEKGFAALLVCGFLLFVLLVFLIIKLFKGLEPRIEEHKKYRENEKEKRQAGRQGEERAECLIRTVMRNSDTLLSNIEINYDGKRTEIDKLIVNQYGIFIIEVKNYKGRLKGKADDYNWQQIKVSPGGNVFTKDVHNPIKQVKRQTYILSNYLKTYGVYNWIEGYVYLINHNSPVKNKMVLWDKGDIYRAIHHTTGQMIDKKMIQRIIQACEEAS